MQQKKDQKSPQSLHGYFIKQPEKLLPWRACPHAPEGARAKEWGWVCSCCAAWFPSAAVGKRRRFERPVLHNLYKIQWARGWWGPRPARESHWQGQGRPPAWGWRGLLKILLTAPLLSHRQALACGSTVLDLAPAPAATQMFSVVLTGIVSGKTLGVILDKRLKLLSATRAGSESLDRSGAAHLAGHVEAKTNC